MSDERLRMLGLDRRMTTIRRQTEKIAGQADTLTPHPLDPLSQISAGAYVDMVSRISATSHYDQALELLAEPAGETGMPWYDALYRPIYAGARSELTGRLRRHMPEGIGRAVDFGARSGMASEVIAGRAEELVAINPPSSLITGNARNDGSS